MGQNGLASRLPMVDLWDGPHQQRVACLGDQRYEARKLAAPAGPRRLTEERGMSTELEIRLFDALKCITKFMTPDQIRRDSKGSGLDYEEYLEMSYENIQAEAKRATHGVRIKRN